MNMKTILAEALSLEDKLSISLTTLLTGFVVVFSVLILLIVIIYVYGQLISRAQNKSKEKKLAKENANKQTDAPAVQSAPVSAVKQTGGLSDEIVAVIAAAVDSTYGVGNARIKSIKKSASVGRPAWGQAAVVENTRPF